MRPLTGVEFDVSAAAAGAGSGEWRSMRMVRSGNRRCASAAQAVRTLDDEELDEVRMTAPEAASPNIAVASPDAVARAGALLRAGGLVAFPTETVYGLGGDATSDAAVARIFEAKGRPSFNPLISHVADVATAQRLAFHCIVQPPPSRLI